MKPRTFSATTAGRQPVGVHLVRVAGEDAVGPDGRAPLDRDPPAREHLLGQRPDVRVAQVEPVAGGVEGEAVPDVGPAQAPRAGLALQQAVAPAEGQGRGDAGEARSQDEDVAVWWRLVHGRRYDSRFLASMQAAPAPARGVRGLPRPMRITCPQCQAGYDVDPEKIPAERAARALPAVRPGLLGAGGASPPPTTMSGQPAGRPARSRPWRAPAAPPARRAGMTMVGMAPPPPRRPSIQSGRPRSPARQGAPAGAAEPARGGALPPAGGARAGRRAGRAPVRRGAARGLHQPDRSHPAARHPRAAETSPTWPPPEEPWSMPGVETLVPSRLGPASPT